MDYRGILATQQFDRSLKMCILDEKNMYFETIPSYSMLFCIPSYSMKNQCYSMLLYEKISVIPSYSMKKSALFLVQSALFNEKKLFHDQLMLF